MGRRRALGRVQGLEGLLTSLSSKSGACFHLVCDHHSLLEDRIPVSMIGINDKHILNPKVLKKKQVLYKENIKCISNSKPYENAI